MKIPKPDFDFKLEEIESITNLGPNQDEWVYDIEMSVKRYPFFFANGIMVHNSSYFSIWNEDDLLHKPITVNASVEKADRICEELNETFPSFMRETFLVNEGFDDKIKASREIVADKGIFVEKKRYFLHLVDKENERVDYPKIMGLDTIKTSIPREIAKVINNWIVDHLKGKSWSIIEKEIVEFKESLMKVDNFMNLGLPKSCNKLEEYTSEFLKDNSTRLPGHVAAAIHYNLMVEHYKDTVNPKISSGNKVKVFYLKKPIGRFKSIAVPSDARNLPEWFVNDFIPNIDTDAQIERLVDNPLGNIISAIGKIPPSKQQLFLESVLEF